MSIANKQMNSSIRQTQVLHKHKQAKAKEKAKKESDAKDLEWFEEGGKVLTAAIMNIEQLDISSSSQHPCVCKESPERTINHSHSQCSQNQTILVFARSGARNRS
jgi:hypothetical protein